MDDVGALLRLPAPASCRDVHGVLESGWGSEGWTFALNQVGKARRPDLSLQLLSLIESGRVQRDVFHHSAVVSSLGGVGGLWPDALDVLRQAEDSGIHPNEYTFGAAMHGACGWLLVIGLLRRMQARRLSSNSFIRTAITGAYATQELWQRALSQHSTHEASTFAVASVMSACEKSSWRRSLELLSDLSRKCSPDLVCYGRALGACAVGQRWQAAVWLLEQMAEEALRPSSQCYNAAISACARSEQWQAALGLFGRLCQETLEPGICCATAAYACQGAYAWQSTLGLLQWQLERRALPDAALAGSAAHAVREHLGTEPAEQLLLRLLQLWKQRWPPEAPRTELDEDSDIISRSPGLVAVCKPPGITTESAVLKMLRLSKDAKATSLHTVSRLDAQTSGVLPLAVGEAARRYFQAQFAGRLVQKEYLCLCEGAGLGAEGATGMVSEPLLTTGIDGLSSRTQISPEGREAHTAYLVKGRYEADARAATELILLKVRPLTGRTHQIRAHLASIGHPIVGDVVYGRARSSLSNRLFLHCARVRVRDLAGRVLNIRAPLPRDLEEALDRLHGKRPSDE